MVIDDKYIKWIIIKILTYILLDRLPVYKNEAAHFVTVVVTYKFKFVEIKTEHIRFTPALSA